MARIKMTIEEARDILDIQRHAPNTFMPRSRVTEALILTGDLRSAMWTKSDDNRTITGQNARRFRPLIQRHE